MVTDKPSPDGCAAAQVRPGQACRRDISRHYTSVHGYYLITGPSPRRPANPDRTSEYDISLPRGLLNAGGTYCQNTASGVPSHGQRPTGRGSTHRTSGLQGGEEGEEEVGAGEEGEEEAGVGDGGGGP